MRNDQKQPTKIMGTAFDITHLKDAELRAENADRSKSEFLANMSHEIRTPMNGIMGMCDLLMVSDVAERERSLVETIQRSSTALLQIINYILDFSKIEAGKMELDPEPFSLKDCIEDVTILLANAKQNTDVDLLVRYSPELPNHDIGDAGRIRQIVTNILGNALKFTHEGHVLLEIDGDVTDGHAKLRFKIEDTGIGIAPEKIDQIFNKFEQADGSTTRKYGGTGLGLSIAKNFLHLMGGALNVTSEVGVGSTFKFEIELPLGKVEIPKIQGELKPRKLKILIIDDNEVNIQTLEEQFKHWHWKAVSVPSAKAGLKVLELAHQKGVKIDLVVLGSGLIKSSISR